MQYYIVKYSGPFGFIKPWTAVRDSETFSQQFLTPSIVEGIEKKLFPELLGEGGIHKIKGHRLSYESTSLQMEQTQTRGWNVTRKQATRPSSILYRGVLVKPKLLLAFAEKQDAIVASMHHICLCRNEDVLYPDMEILEVSQDQFDSSEQFAGFELVFEENEASFAVGFNRFQDAKPMHGWLRIVGKPVGNPSTL